MEDDAIDESAADHLDAFPCIGFAARRGLRVGRRRSTARQAAMIPIRNLRELERALAMNPRMASDMSVLLHSIMEGNRWCLPATAGRWLSKTKVAEL